MKAHIPTKLGDYVPLGALRKMVEKLEDRSDDTNVLCRGAGKELLPCIADLCASG